MKGTRKVFVADLHIPVLKSWTSGLCTYLLLIQLAYLAIESIR